MPGKFWVHGGSEALGPFAVEEIRRRVPGFGPDTVVARDGATDQSSWKPASEFPELAPVLAAPPDTPRMPPAPGALIRPPSVKPPEPAQHMETAENIAPRAEAFPIEPQPWPKGVVEPQPSGEGPRYRWYIQYRAPGEPQVSASIAEGLSRNDVTSFIYQLQHQKFKLFQVKPLSEIRPTGLVACAHCRKPVSTKAMSCPACGRPSPAISDPSPAVVSPPTFEGPEASRNVRRQAELEPMKRCALCGTDNMGNYLCSGCGANLDEPTTRIYCNRCHEPTLSRTERYRYMDTETRQGRLRSGETFDVDIPVERTGSRKVCRNCGQAYLFEVHTVTGYAWWLDTGMFAVIILCAFGFESFGTGGRRLLYILLCMTGLPYAVARIAAFDGFAVAGIARRGARARLVSMLVLIAGVLYRGNLPTEPQASSARPASAASATTRTASSPRQQKAKAPKAASKSARDMSVDELEKWLRKDGPTPVVRANSEHEIATIWKSLESCVEKGVPARSDCAPFDSQFEQFAERAGPDGARTLVEYAERHYEDERERLRLLLWLQEHNEARR